MLTPSRRASQANANVHPAHTGTKQRDDALPVDFFLSLYDDNDNPHHSTVCPDGSAPPQTCRRLFLNDVDMLDNAATTDSCPSGKMDLKQNYKD